MVWCVMVKGPCRGEKCDFWARVRLRNQTLDEIVDGIQRSLTPCIEPTGLETREALDRYWAEVGVRDMELLCQEEPDLCAKIRKAEAVVYSRTGQPTS